MSKEKERNNKRQDFEARFFTNQLISRITFCEIKDILMYNVNILQSVIVLTFIRIFHHISSEMPSKRACNKKPLGPSR